MAGIEIGRYSLDGSVTGAGAPLLFLHGGDYVAQNAAFLGRLARRWRVTAPRHPGFGHSERPDGFRTIHDLAYLYLDWIDRQPGDVVLVGSSFGGWIALEMCVRSVARIRRLVLIDSLGLKFGGREERDIAGLPVDPVEIEIGEIVDRAKPVGPLGMAKAGVARRCDPPATRQPIEKGLVLGDVVSAV